MFYIHGNPSASICGRVLLLFFLLFSHAVHAQYSVSANDDNAIKWRQIQTKSFRLVYPDFYEDDAQKLARVLDTVSLHIGNSLGTTAPRIPVLIHTNGSKSNGLLVWAPKRMEFWTTPPPDHYAYPWSWQLALHEYRHACQMQALNKGITKCLNAVFGEHILGAVSGLLVPLWFMEGDAVVAETSMSPTGRGHTPEYKMLFKAQLLEKGAYKFDKAKLGSRRDYIPNQYVFGYYMTAFSRSIYGRDVFADVMESTAKHWWRGAWFSKAGKRPYSDSRVYEQMADSLLRVWKTERKQWQEKENKSAIEEIEIRKRHYTNYKNPIQIGQDSIIALQSSSFGLQTLVLITKGKVHKLRSLPYLKHSYFDYKDGKVLYSQESANQRWGQQNNADIIEYDFRKKKYRLVTSDAIFFNPVYNPVDKNLIAAIETDRKDNQSLVILSPGNKFLYTKNVLQKNKHQYIASIGKENDVAFSFPCWSEDGKVLYVIETSVYGKCIAKYDIATGVRSLVTASSYDDISRLQTRNGRLYFIKDVKGKYELVSMNLESGACTMESDTEYGISSYCITETPFHADETGNHSDETAKERNGNADLILSAYNSDGFRLVRSKAMALPVDLNEPNPEPLFVSDLRKEEGFILDASFMNDTTAAYESKPYSKPTHLFNFHSWAPFFMNVTKQDLGIGVSFFSQNLLSTSVLQFGYKYNPQDIKHELYLTYNYSGFYPIFDVETNYKMRSMLLSSDTTDLYAQWNEWMSGLNMTLPYTCNTQRTVNKVSLVANYSFRKLVPRKLINPHEEFRILDLFNTFGLGFRLSMLSAQAYNDIVPSWGEVIKLNYKTTLTSNPAEYFSFSSTTYVPFIFKNQSLQFTFNYQKNAPETYYFPNEIAFTKGVYNQYPAEYHGISLTLHTPICYPDLRLGAILYCKRITAAPFYEQGFFDKEKRRSIGSDISLNMHLFRIQTAVEMGFRLGYLPETKETFFNILFSLDL